MKTIFAIGSVLASVVASFVITWLVWEMGIEGRAFDCIDSIPWIPSDGFWTSIDTHQSAGDRLRPGWTWDELRRTRRAYQLAFVVISVAGSALSLRILRRISHEHSSANAA
jgi:hypothetical protein